MKNIKNFEEFLNEGYCSANESEVTLPYEGSQNDAVETAKEYGLKIKKTHQSGVDRATGMTVVTFVGPKNKIIDLLDEWGGEENVLNTMDEPYGRIVESNSLGKNPTTAEVAKYVWDNWKKITGLRDSDRDEEGHFPDEVDDILDKYGIDYDDFSDEWGYLGMTWRGQVNEGLKTTTVYLYGGRKKEYSDSDIEELIQNFNVISDDLPKWLYKASMSNPENPSFPKSKKGVLNLLKLILKAKENVEINIASDQPGYLWYIRGI